MNQTVVGIDIAKRVFQLHWVDVDTGELVSLQLKREKFLRCEYWRPSATAPASLGTGAKSDRRS